MERNAMVLRYNGNFNRWKVKAFTTKLPLLKMTLDLTSRQKDSGELDSSELFSMLETPTPLLSPALELYLTPTIIRKISKH